jgi:hypothetical protein
MTADPVFQPVNDLERVLLRAKGGWIPVPEFVDEMLRSKVVLLIDREVGPEGWDNTANPLVLATHEGGPGVCIFTSMERPGVWLDRFPEFQYGLTVEFGWFVRGVQPGTAVLVNPGWDEGLIIRPDTVQELRRAVQAA